MNKSFAKILPTVTLSLFAASTAWGEVMIYPKKGQSNEQLARDRYECHIWAVQQSGFDPSSAQAGSSGSGGGVGDGEMLRGGARGAAAGAAIGAIAGDAGKGAAIGAAAGAMKRGFERRDKSRSGQTQVSPGQDAYDRAFKACLSGRDYSVN